MSTDDVITPEEYEIVNNVVAGFMRKARRNPRWEVDDIRQELLIFWIKKKRSGWHKPLDFLDLLDRQGREICELLMKGYSKKEIARRLNLSSISLYRKIREVRKVCQENFKIS